MKKVLTLLLCGVILASSIPLNTYAAMADNTKASVPSESTSVAVSDTAADAAVNSPVDAAANPSVDAAAVSKAASSGKSGGSSDGQLESAIKAVKSKVTIPAQYSDFNYYFYNTGSDADSYWSLTWRNPSDDSEIQVNCDQGYRITYYRINDSSRDDNSSIPAYLKKELKSKADDFIKQVAPQIFGGLEYVDADYNGIYSGDYVYNYRRIENNVIFPDNTVSVSVSSVTGQVHSASLSWLYDTAIPASKAKLTQEDAAKIIKENMKMNLVYRSNYYYIYDTNSNNKVKAFLVYEPSKTYISVDAVTGEVYLTQTQWQDTAATDENGYGGMGSMESAKSDAGSMQNQLTDEEISKIEELKNLISKEAAIKAVTQNKYLYMESTIKAYTATLNKINDGNGKNSYVWEVSLSDPREVDYSKDTDTYRAFANAQVDAKTGKILSYYSSIKSLYDAKTGKWDSVKVPFDKEKSRANLEKFLKLQISSRFNNTKLSDTREDYVAYYKADNTPVYGGYSYRYNRVNSGIEYPYNGIDGSVDGVTGKIYSFNCSWNDNVEFESPKGAMDADKAIDQYLGKDGYGLKYEINVIQKYDSKLSAASKAAMVDVTDAYSVKNEVRLVYRPDINPYYISPFTGEQLTSRGEVYKETQPYSYVDVPDTKENREILLLADMNIGFEGDHFYPDNNITNGQIADIMQKVGYGNNEDKTKDASKFITREELAYEFISMLGLEKISGVSGIYKTGTADEDSISQKYLGAVALAKGLGLMDADANNRFNPKDNVTRAQAVHIILKFIETMRKGVIY